MVGPSVTNGGAEKDTYLLFVGHQTIHKNTNPVVTLDTRLAEADRASIVELYLALFYLRG